MDVFFWVVDLLIPFAVVLIGLLFTLRPPRRINMIYGYRTVRSMSSQPMWDAAHKAYGRISIRTGPALIGFVVIAKLLVPLPPEILSLILLPFSFAALIIPIFAVEKHLKRLEREDTSPIDN